MGFNTTIVILNDQWHEYEDHPDRLISDIREVMSLVGCESHSSPMIFGHTHHASANSVIMVGGNMARVLGYADVDYHEGKDSPEVQAVRDIAAQLGYRLVRKPKKR